MTMSSDDDPYAHAWDVVTCTNGHPMYILLTTPKRGSPLEPKHFQALGKASPISSGLVIPICPKCSENFTFRNDGEFGYRFFIRGQWRGVRP